MDRLDQSDIVMRYLQEAFQIVVSKEKSAIGDERSFDFDVQRYYCRLLNHPNPDANVFQFEVQVRTILQHAWCKVTHPYVYKARIHGAREARLASEILAQIESIDRMLINFDEVAKGVKRINRKELEACNAFVSIFDALVTDRIIPSEMRPRNGRRLGENVYNALNRHKRLDIYNEAILEVYRFIRSLKPSAPGSITLFQLSIIIFHRKNWLDYGKDKRRRYYFVSPEMITLFPESAEIKNRIEFND